MAFKAKTKELLRQAFDKGYDKGFEAGMARRDALYNQEHTRNSSREGMVDLLEAHTPEANNA